jgi:hypothetical protein
MAYVEYEMVTGAVKDPMHGHGQLYRSQIGGQMAAGFGDGIHQRAADLVAQSGHGLGRQSAHVGRGLNMGQIRGMFKAPRLLFRHGKPPPFDSYSYYCITQM